MERFRRSVLRKSLGLNASLWVFLPPTDRPNPRFPETSVRYLNCYQSGGITTFSRVE